MSGKKKKKKIKKPHTKVIPSLKKEPRVSIDAKSYYQERASWHVQILDKEGPFGWQVVNEDKIWEIIKKMGEFEKLKWAEIIGDKNHFIEIADLDSEVQKRLREIRQTRVDSLFSLRLKGKERVIGIMDHRGFLKILWWDPEHKVCPATKKHT